jgi:rubrerythrin
MSLRLEKSMEKLWMSNTDVLQLFQPLLRLVTQGAGAYLQARHMSDPQIRPDAVAAYCLTEGGAVPYLEALSKRAATEGDSWLAESLYKHAQDERRHAAIFAKSLERAGFSLKEAQPAQESRAKGGKGFFDHYYGGLSKEELRAERIDWVVMMASTHVLEADAQHDFARMARALPLSDPLRSGLIGIALDEGRHAAYLREALIRKMGRTSSAQAQIELFKERKAQAIFKVVLEGVLGGNQVVPPRLSKPVEVEEQVSIAA